MIDVKKEIQTRKAKGMMDAQIMASLFMDNFDRTTSALYGPADRSLMGPEQAKYFTGNNVNLTSSYEPTLWQRFYEEQVQNYCHLLNSARKNGDHVVLSYIDGKPYSFDYYTDKNGTTVKVPEHCLF